MYTSLYRQHVSVSVAQEASFLSRATCHSYRGEDKATQLMQLLEADLCFPFNVTFQCAHHARQATSVIVSVVALVRHLLRAHIFAR